MKKVFAILIIAALIAPASAFAEGVRGNVILRDTGYGVVVGAILGAAVMTLT